MRHPRDLPTALVSLTLVASCGSGSGASDAAFGDGGGIQDAGAADAGAPDAGQADTGTPDGGEVFNCAPRVLKNKDGSTATKFVLTMFHFNLQYVATDIPENLKKYEDAIIRIGFKPLLDVLDSNPSFTLSFEFQGYMLEQMAKNQPKVFDRFRAKVQNCQAEFVSFHYSDQLFIAYGERDMEWSHALNEGVFSAFGLHPSGVVFTQEGQFGEGMLDFMQSHGKTIALYPSNLFGWFTGGDKAYPLWERWGTQVIPVGIGFNLTDPAPISVSWNYYNDGELLTTGGFSPYFVDTGNYVVDKASIQKWVDEVAALEQQGYVVASIADYVETIKALGVKPEPLPDPLDGTWQPRDTDNVHRWMGQRKADIERDYEVLTGNWRARAEVLAAETMLAAAKAAGKGADQEAALAAAKRDLALAQVSDSTGWTPSAQEVDYSLNHATLARDAAAAAVAALKPALGVTNAAIDTGTGAVAEGTAPVDPQTIECPAEIAQWALTTTDYDYARTCYQPASERFEVRYAFTPKVAGGGGRTIGLSIPADATYIEYTPALLDHYDADKAMVKYPASEFLQDAIWLPLGNGLIGLGNGAYLVTHNEYLHLAAGIMKGPPGAILFQDSTAPKTGQFEWRLSLVRGDAATAYGWAKKINTHPVVYR